VNESTKPFFDWCYMYRAIAMQSTTAKPETTIQRELQKQLLELSPILSRLAKQLETKSIPSTACHKLDGELYSICMKNASSMMGQVEPMLDAVWVDAKRLDSMPSTTEDTSKFKYGRLREMYLEAKNNTKLSKSEQSYRAITERYWKTLDTNNRPSVATLKKWLERPENH